MDQYQWTTTEIDKQDFYKTVELVFEEFDGAEEEPVYYIDQVLK